MFWSLSETILKALTVWVNDMTTAWRMDFGGEHENKCYSLVNVCLLRPWLKYNNYSDVLECQLEELISSKNSEVRATQP